MVFYPSQTVTGGDLPVGAMIIVQDHCQSAHANTLYGLEITPDDSEVNPYTPFASQFDWDIAKWAKLHYPGVHTVQGINVNSQGMLLTIFESNLAK